MKKKIILDTDIGSDIDDAICLAYLLSQPDCILKGITTVSGEPVKRASLASAICMEKGVEIPIYPGIENPITGPQRQSKASQAAALINWKHKIDFPENQALEFLKKTIHENPGEISLLAIGPMTNIGLLFASDPEIPGLLKELVLMCGVFTPVAGPCEWNALCDPVATSIVYNAKPAVHRSIGLDVTCKVSMGKQEIIKYFQADILKPVLDFAKVWFEHTDQITFHDPLAAVTMFDNDVCKFKKGNVDVELTSERLKGFTYWKENSENGKHEVALDVDKERFFNHFAAVVK